MKQKYISPAMMVVSLNTVTMLAGSVLSDTSSPNVTVTTTEYNGEFYTREQSFDDGIW